MMRLPARLATKLGTVRFAQTFKFTPLGPLVHCVDPAEILHPDSAAPVCREKMQGLTENRSPVIWIGGREPLLHAGISHFVRAIAQSGHFVFLETGGTLLRRRVHEFQPLPQIFLTVRFDSLQAPDSSLAVEGLRAAQLSGFFTVVHSLFHNDADVAQLKALSEFIEENDADGWLITSGSEDEAVVRKTAEGRRLIPSRFWRVFSKHVEKALLSQNHAAELDGASASVAANLQTGRREESVRVA